MRVPLSTLVPNPEDLLSLDTEEVGWVLLAHLSSLADSVDGTFYQGRINQYNFFNALNQRPDYPNRQAEVNDVLLEAWNWLQGEGFLVRDAGSNPDIFFISRRAKRLRDRAHFDEYRKAVLLPKGQLHPLIASKVYPAFLRGEYDTAVFQAFREVEVAVRGAGKFPDDRVGVSLMRDAFRALGGPLTDDKLPIAEQEGMAHLFSGAIALYKNPQSHRNVPTEAADAAEIIVFASHLLRIVDRLSSP
jgi:uncharacterized protein (TIGR02391 family)